MDFHTFFLFHTGARIRHPCACGWIPELTAGGAATPAPTTISEMRVEATFLRTSVHTTITTSYHARRCALLAHFPTTACWRCGTEEVRTARALFGEVGERERESEEAPSNSCRVHLRVRVFGCALYVFPCCCGEAELVLSVAVLSSACAPRVFFLRASFRLTKQSARAKQRGRSAARTHARTHASGAVLR